MSIFKPIANRVIPQHIAEVSAVALLPLGTKIRAVDKDTTAYGEAEFIYLKGVASTVEGSVVIYSQDDYSTALAVANGIGSIAVAMGACVANQFGWYQVQGKAVGRVLASFADNAMCYLTATAGSIDDAAVAGDLIYKCRSGSAIGTPAANLAELEIDYPFVQDGTTV